VSVGGFLNYLAQGFVVSLGKGQEMNTGYVGHFTGAFICFICGAVCDCGDE